MGHWVRSALPHALGFAISQPLFFLPAPRYWAGDRLVWATSALLSPSLFRAKAVAASACTHPSLPLPLFPSPLPPAGSGETQGTGLGGGGSVSPAWPRPRSRLFLGTRPEALRWLPGWSSCERTASAPRSAPPPPRRSPGLRLQPARKRAIRAATLAPGSQLSVSGFRSLLLGARPPHPAP